MKRPRAAIRESENLEELGLMTKPPKKPKAEEIETKPDGWDRFTKAVKRMAPPKPHKKDRRKQKPDSKTIKDDDDG